jgi:CBS domain-containing protein
VVRTTDTLRAALSLLVQSAGGGVPVVDETGAPVGRLTFDDIRQAVLDSREAAVSR